MKNTFNLSYLANLGKPMSQFCVVFSFIFIFSAISLSAQVPQKMSYQAVVVDNNQEPVIGKVGMQISIL